MTKSDLCIKLFSELQEDQGSATIDCCTKNSCWRRWSQRDSFLYNRMLSCPSFWLPAAVKNRPEVSYKIVRILKESIKWSPLDFLNCVWKLWRIIISERNWFRDYWFGSRIDCGRNKKLGCWSRIALLPLRLRPF